MVFYNASGAIGAILTSSSNHVTGSEAITIMIFLVALFVFGLSFRFPTMLVLLLAMPFVIILMAYNTTFMLIGGIMLFMLAGMLTKMFFLN